jgi:hypothetical protein
MLASHNGANHNMDTTSKFRCTSFMVEVAYAVERINIWGLKRAIARDWIESSIEQPFNFGTKANLLSIDLHQVLWLSSVTPRFAVVD